MSNGWDRGRLIAGWMAVPCLAVALTILAMPAGATVRRWSKVEGYPGYSGWQQQLQHMADADGRFPVSRFCIVVATGATAAPARKYAWAYVHWREARRLYTFGQSAEAMSDLTQFKLPLDLTRDVVPRERDVGSSTYRVTRSWVADVLAHCVRSGTSFTAVRHR